MSYCVIETICSLQLEVRSSIWNVFIQHQNDGGSVLVLLSWLAYLNLLPPHLTFLHHQFLLPEENNDSSALLHS